MSTQVVRVVQGPTKVVTIPRAVGAPGHDGEDGAAGSDGREIALRTATGFVQWQYDGDPGWTNLIALADLTGPRGDDGTDGTNGVDGKSVELRVSGGSIQWRQTGSAWTDLVALTAITGPAGEDGAPGAPGGDGEDGAPGVGVPAGGTTGQVLTKTGPGDYATGWTESSGGGGSDAATAGWVADEDSLTRTALDAAFVGSDTIRRIITTSDPDAVAAVDELLVVLPAPRVVGVAWSDLTMVSGVSMVSAVTPADIQAGDLIVALVACHYTGTLTPPAGWTQVAAADAPGTAGGAGLNRVRAFTKTASGSESGSTVTFTQSVAGRMGLTILVLRGAGGVTLAQASTATYATTTAAPGLHPIPAATATQRGMLAVHLGCCALSSDTVTIAVPASWQLITPAGPLTGAAQVRAWAAVRALAEGESTDGVATHAGSPTHDGASILLLFRSA